MEDECNCQTPGDRDKDFIYGYVPKKEGGYRLGWYARKDCPIHGMKEVSVTDIVPAEPQPE